MTALVTGAAGFIGSTLSERLLREGENVVGVDSITDYYDVRIKRQNIARLQEYKGFKFLEADLNDVDLLAILKSVDTVYHQAGQPGVRKSWGTDFSEYIDANISATQRLLEAAKTSDIERLVYASSSSIYGNADAYPTPELAVPSPVSPYGVTKLAAEHMCTLYATNFGVPTVSLRYFTVYGPRQRPDMAFTRFTRAATTGELITVFGDGNQIRDFTFVDDIVNANILAGTGLVKPGSVYNVAGGSSVSVNDVLTTLSEISEKKLRVEYVPAVPGDVRRTGGDTKEAEAGLGWTPTVPLGEGLERHYAWARKVFSE